MLILGNPCLAVHELPPACISAVMAKQEREGYGFRNPIYRPALAGAIELFEVIPTGRVPARAMKAARGNCIIVLGDDGPVPSGPDGFPNARRAIAAATHVMLNAAGGETEHYAIVASAAGTPRARVLLIETDTAHRGAWWALLDAEKARRQREARRPFAFLAVLTAPGDFHPSKPWGC